MMCSILLIMMLFLKTVFLFLRLMLILIQTSLNTYLLNDLIDSSHLILLEITRTSLNILSIYCLRMYLFLGPIMITLGNLLFLLSVCRCFSWIWCGFFSMSASWHHLFLIFCWNILPLIAPVYTCSLVRS